MRWIRIVLVMLGVFCVAACGGEETTTREALEPTSGSEVGDRAEDEMPESPKVKADDPRYGY